MHRALAVTPLVALALAGCGQSSSSSSSSDFSGEEAKVAKVIDDLSSDGKDRKPADICDELLAASLKQRITSAGGKCATEMRKAIEDADGFDLTVKDVNVTGKSATAQVRSTDDGKTLTRTFSLKAEGGKWRIEKFGT
jgi:hypothetical protein